MTNIGVAVTIKIGRMGGSKEMRNKNLLLVALLLLSVGFAAVTTTLTINGFVSVRPSYDDFDDNVIFKSITVDSESVAKGTTASISDAGKKITFTTHKLNSIGEKVKIDYTIENKSQYNALMGELTCSSTDAGWDTYLSLTTKNTLNGKTIESGATSGVDSIEIEMIKSFVGVGDVNEKTYTFTCSLPVEAKELS